MKTRLECVNAVGSRYLVTVTLAANQLEEALAQVFLPSDPGSVLLRVLPEVLPVLVLELIQVLAAVQALVRAPALLPPAALAPSPAEFLVAGHLQAVLPEVSLLVEEFPSRQVGFPLVLAL